MTISTIVPAADTYVYDQTPNTAADQGSTVAKLLVGFNGRDVAGEWRSWVRFDLSAITAGSTINSATLRVHVYFSDTSSTYGSQDIGAYRSTDITWAETITWNTQPSSNGTATYDIWFDSSSNWDHDFIVTSDVAAALSTGGVSWVIKSVAIGQYSDFYQWKMQDDDYTVGPPAQQRSQLIVDWTAPSGFKSQTVFIM